MANEIEYYLGLKYQILVRSNDSGGFSAEVAELPGCLADGDTEDEARSALEEAKRLWIQTQLKDGDPIPEPRV